MKYFLIGSMMVAAFTATARQPRSKPFSLSGEVTGAGNGVMYIGYEGAGGKRVKDSAILKNGQFRFTGMIDHPVMAYVNFNNTRAGMDDPNVFSFFLDPADMKVSLVFNQFKDAQISGSKTQDEYAILQKQQTKFHKRWQIVMDTLAAINKRSNFQYQETKNWALAPYNEELNEVTAEFIQQHPASYVTAWLLRFERGMKADSLKKIYNNFPAEVKESSYGKAVAVDLENRKKGIPGVKAPLFSSPGIDGKTVSLADYRGKYVILDFWASWCLPCRKGNPHMKELYARYRQKGFEVIGIASDDTKPEAWKNAVAQDGLPWKQVLTGLKVTRVKDEVIYDKSQSISEGYNISTLPTLILIDPDGVILGRYLDELGEPHEALDKKLEEIFR